MSSEPVAQKVVSTTPSTPSTSSVQHFPTFTAHPLRLQYIPVETVVPHVFHSGHEIIQSKLGSRSWAKGMEPHLSASIHSAEQVDQLHRASICYIAYREKPPSTKTWLTPIVPTDTATGKKRAGPLVQVLNSRLVRVNAWPHASWNDPLSFILMEHRKKHQSNSTSDRQWLSLSIMQEWTRDRIRVSGQLGRVYSKELDGFDAFEIETDLVMSLCPKYIADRRIIDLRSEYIASQGRATVSSGSVPRGGDTRLPDLAHKLIRTADTFWISSGVDEWGATSSHRGGKPGFVRLIHRDERLCVEWGDYQGNNFFHSLGNAVKDPHVGLTFLDFSTHAEGSILQVTGTMEIVHSHFKQGELDFSDRRLRVWLDEWRLVQNALPFTWNTIEESSFNHPLKEMGSAGAQQLIDEEADVVTSEKTPSSHEIEEEGRPLALINVLNPQDHQSLHMAGTAHEDPVRTFRFAPAATSSDASLEPFRFLAGQYGTFDLTLQGQTHTRCWTLTSLPGATALAPSWHPLAGKSIPVLEISVKLQQQGAVSPWLHQAAKDLGASNDVSKRLTVRLKGIEGKFILPSAYWNSTAGNKFQPTDRLMLWRDGVTAMKQVASPSDEGSADAIPAPPALRLVMWSGGIGVTPLLALQQFLMKQLDESSSAIAPASPPNRFVWIYAVPHPRDVCFVPQLQQWARLASSTRRLRFSIAFFFTRAKQEEVDHFEQHWKEAVGACVPTHGQASFFKQRPSVDVIHPFLAQIKQSADQADAEAKVDSPRFAQLNYVCGPASFLEFSRTAIADLHQKQPGLTSERIRLEEFTY